MGKQKEYMNIAWEVVRKLISLSKEDRENIFGYSDVERIIRNYSANQTNYKIFQYEKMLKEEIKVGDIVNCCTIRDGVVVNIFKVGNNEHYYVLFPDGGHYKFLKDELEKTGRSVDILNELSELILG